jgi:hypothetical protein
MNTREYLLALFDIHSGSLPITIASDEFIFRELLSDLISKGYVSTIMQAPDNSVFINLSITESSKNMLAELRLTNPELSKTLPFREYRAITMNIIYFVVTWFVMDFFFRVFRGGH